MMAKEDQLPSDGINEAIKLPGVDVIDVNQ